jgi:hypothetical protein
MSLAQLLEEFGPYSYISVNELKGGSAIEMSEYV